jgi:SAM-dependent methyltransferase
MAPAARRAPLALAALAFFASGLAALVYQVAWQRVLALHTGAGIYSVALIVAAFMAGLGIGSHLGGIASVRLSPRHALLAFGVLEILIASFGAVSISFYYDLLYVHGRALYASPWLAGLLHFASLLPPTALMGMSLPFLTRAMVEDTASAGRTVGVLYGINMLGAGAGALLAPWVLVRHLGLPGAVLVAAGANALAGVAALALARRRPAAASPGPPPIAEVEGEARRPLALWLGLYAASGFFALSLEILWFRLLDVTTRSTAFTFGTLLAIYLFGSAAGCLAGARWAARLRRPLKFFLLCQCGLLAYSGLAVLALVTLPATTPGLAWYHDYWRSGDIFHLGDTWDPARILGLYVVLPVVLFGPPTVMMGLSFPALQKAVHDDPLTCGRKVGLLQAANIVGCVTGSLAVGLAGLTWLGTGGSLRLLLVGGTAFAALGVRACGARGPFLPLAAVLLLSAAALPERERLWLRLSGTASPQGMAEEDATGVGAILPWSDGWHVAVNGKHHSWLPFGGTHTRLGAIPALVHPAPLDVAIIGLGSGDTAWAAACRRETRSLVVFEIAGPQPALLARLARRESLPELRDLLRDPRLAVHLADGRHALARGEERYDLIEADALWPYAAYSGNLYSVEFFRECARRLKPGGLMCTWAPTERVRASFHAAFPHVVGPRNRSFLVGSNEPIAVEPAAWRERLLSPEVTAYLGERRVADILPPLEKLRVLGPPAGDAALNHDLHPRDEFLAP